MTEHIRFHFDPICPWCYQTSRWLKRVAELGEVELTWGLFSLELQNAGDEPEELASAHARSKLALATAVAVREEGVRTPSARSTAHSVDAYTNPVSRSANRTPSSAPG